MTTPITPTTPTNPTIEQMHAHRSIRKYTADLVPRADILAAMRGGQAAATSSAVQSYSVLHITDDEKRQRIADLCGPQQKVRDCGAFFVVCADLRKHMLIFERAGTPYDQRLEAFLVAAIDATLFAQNFVLAFESLGYGTCYIGGLRNDLAGVDRVLGLPEGVCPVYGLCVGVADESPMPRPRLAPEAMLFENSYPSDEETLAHIDRYDEVYRAYLRERGATPAGWSEAMLAKFAQVSRPGLSAYYQSKGARVD